ncbi:MAG: hypothetical protein GXO10_04940 [Crenarchaeota archaeon]|nr:hypothetical protein [Thermoproteota archaeon]
MDVTRLTPVGLVAKCSEFKQGTKRHEKYKKELCKRRGFYGAMSQFTYLRDIGHDEEVRNALLDATSPGACWQVTYCEQIANDPDMVDALLKHNPDKVFFALIEYLNEVEYDNPKVRERLSQAKMFPTYLYHRLSND